VGEGEGETEYKKNATFLILIPRTPSTLRAAKSLPVTAEGIEQHVGSGWTVTFHCCERHVWG